MHGRDDSDSIDVEDLEHLGWKEAWDLHGIIRVHPSHIVGPVDRVIVDVWLAYRPDGMGGRGHLPFSGGYVEQPSALMRLLDAMNSAEGRIRARMKPNGN